MHVGVGYRSFHSRLGSSLDGVTQASQKQKRKGEKTKGLFPDTPKADIEATDARPHPATVRNANVRRIIGPRPPTQHSLLTVSRSLWIPAFLLRIIRRAVLIGCPLPNVPEHVV